jgi:alpha-amylase
VGAERLHGRLDPGSGRLEPGRRGTAFRSHLPALAGHGHPAGEHLLEYKYIKKDPDGTIEWENGGNRSYTTGASGAVTLNDTWH